MSDSWQAVAADHVRNLGLDPGCLEVLRAFASTGEEPPAAGGLAAEVRAASERAPSLGEGIARLVGEEVDADQARMFARRFAAVDRALAAAAAPEAGVLRVGLSRRMAGILRADGPRVLRVRACVDFYAGHGALLAHRHRLAGRAVPTLAERARAAAWRAVAPGVEHALLEGDTPRGPVHINLLRARGCRLRALDLWPLGGDLVDLANREGAVAGLSGGYFLYSETDIRPPARRHDPVGLLVVDGEVIHPPVFRRGSLLQAGDGRLAIERVGPAGARVRWEGGPWLDLADGDLVNRARGEVAPPAPWAVAVSGLEVVDSGPGALDVPLAGAVILLDAPPARLPRRGARLEWRLPGAPAMAVAGGPVLVERGRVGVDLAREDFAGSAPPATFSRDETLDQNLLPRLAVGLASDGAFVAAAVDGRHLERAPGLTLAETGALMVAAGCERALNLDGGSSKRLVIGGRQVDLATTEVVGSFPAGGDPVPSRPVHTALLVYSP